MNEEKRQQKMDRMAKRISVEVFNYFFPELVGGHPASEYFEQLQTGIEEDWQCTASWDEIRGDHPDWTMDMVDGEYDRVLAARCEEEHAAIHEMAKGKLTAMVKVLRGEIKAARKKCLAAA